MKTTRTPTRILFLCTGNSCRSQMAEGWLRHLGNNRFEVFSAGIETHGQNPRAIAAMQEAGVDISKQKSEALDPALLTTIDLLITVCGHADAHCPAIPIACRKEHWPFDDPAKTYGSEKEVTAEFNRIRDQIKTRISEFVNQ